MSTATKSWEDWYIKEAANMLQHMEEDGVSRMEKCFSQILDRWQHVEIKIALPGASGVGKSSFVNAIRGLEDDHKDAAPTGVKETTNKPSFYHLHSNSKIVFCDLPGIGTKNHPDIETYCKNVKLENYDTFLIMSMKRFTQHDRLLAEKIEVLGKSFFFIRTHFDVDYDNEKKKEQFNEKNTMDDIKEECFENLKDLPFKDDNVFLISNRHPLRWEFPRLKQAILDALPIHQRECLTLSLTNLSKDMLDGKVALLRGRIWMVAASSALSGEKSVLPDQKVTLMVNSAKIMDEIRFYESQLGLENNKELISCLGLISCLAPYAVKESETNHERFTSFVGDDKVSFSVTFKFLNDFLNDLKSKALVALQEASGRVANDYDIN